PYTTLFRSSPYPCGLPGEAAQNSADQMPPVTTPGTLLHAIALAAVGGESSVSEIVIASPLRLAAVPRRSIPGHTGFATPRSSNVLPARVVPERALSGHGFV